MKFFLYFILFFFIDIKSHEFNPAHLVVDQLESEKFDG